MINNSTLPIELQNNYRESAVSILGESIPADKLRNYTREWLLYNGFPTLTEEEITELILNNFKYNIELDAFNLKATPLPPNQNKNFI